MPPDREWRDCAASMRKRARWMDRRAWWCLVGALAVLGLASITILRSEDFFKGEIERELLQVRGEIEREERELAQIKVEIEQAKGADLSAVRIVGADGKKVVAVGDDGIILRSLNGGREWQHRHSRTEADLHALSSNSKGDWVITVGTNGTAQFSKNGGQRWRTGKTTTEKTFNDGVLSDDGSRAIAVGRRGTVHFSENGGRSWTRAEVRWKQGDKAAGKTLNAVVFSAGKPARAVAIGMKASFYSAGTRARPGHSTPTRSPKKTWKRWCEAEKNTSLPWATTVPWLFPTMEVQLGHPSGRKTEEKTSPRSRSALMQKQPSQ